MDAYNELNRRLEKAAAAGRLQAEIDAIRQNGDPQELQTAFAMRTIRRLVRSVASLRPYTETKKGSWLSHKIVWVVEPALTVARIKR